MPILVQCPNPECGVTSRADESFEGRNVRCKKCGRPFVAQPTLDGIRSDTKKGRPPSPSDPFPVLPAEFGRYRVLRLLGKGGMGAVYLAEDTQLRREVALKIPFFDALESPDRVERFVREARSAAALQHAGICTVFDAGQLDGRPFITMAFIAGTPLDGRIDPDSPMPQVEAAAIARRIALALEHAHGKGIVHRDLKPANVMIAADGDPVVMDFGLARRVAEVDPNEAKLTRDGGVLGTPSYMSPEQVRGDGAKIGAATDIYSLGVVLFQMLTGRVPYSGSLGVVMGQILSAPAPPVGEFRPEVDLRLDVICRKAMAKDPAKRYASMAEMAHALDRFLNSSANAATIPIPAEPIPVAQPQPVRKPSPPETRTSVDPFARFDGETFAATAPDPNLGRTRPPRRRLLLAASLLVPLIAVLGAVAFRVESAEGTLVVELNDAEVEAKVKNGKLILTGPDGVERYTLTPGEGNKKIDAGAYKIRVDGADGLTLDVPEFVLKKGDKVTVRVTAVPPVANAKGVAKGEKPPSKDEVTVRPSERILHRFQSGSANTGYSPNKLRLMADGIIYNRRNEPLPGTWELSEGGRKVVLHWKNAVAPGGFWVDTYTSDDGVEFRGANNARPPRRFVARLSGPPTETESADDVKTDKLIATLIGHSWHYADPPYPPTEACRFFEDGSFHSTFKWRYWVVGPNEMRVQYDTNSRNWQAGVRFTFDDDFTRFSGEFEDEKGRLHRVTGIRN